MLLGMMFGSIGGSLQSGKFGRKHSIMIDAILFILSTIAMVFAPNLLVVLISRFLQGYRKVFLKTYIYAAYNPTRKYLLRTFVLAPPERLMKFLPSIKHA